MDAKVGLEHRKSKGQGIKAINVPLEADFALNLLPLIPFVMHHLMQKIFVWFLGLMLVFGEVKTHAQTYEDILKQAKSELSIKEKHFFQSQNSTQFNGSNMDVTHYGAYWWINPANDSIRGKVAIAFNAIGPMDAIQLDFAANLKVDSVKFRNTKVNSSFTSAYTLSIPLLQTVPNGQKDSIVVWYHGRPAASDMGSFSRFVHDTGPLIYTLSEPYGAKDWWPCKQSLVDKPDSIDVTIYTPSPYVGVSNGLLVGQSAQNGIRTYHWKHRYPIATYLVAIAVSNYSHFRLNAVLGGDTLPIDNYCYPQFLPDWQTNMPAIVGIIQDFDTVISPYPFKKEKYGHAQFPFGGGMEHQTITFMGGTNFDLQAHELAHHWFGDYVTCASWKDIWLNEGFATYMACYELDRAGIASWKMQAASMIDGIGSDSTGSVLCTDTTNVGRIFDGRLSYGKGAFLVRMLRWRLGDAAFWIGIRNYLHSPAHKYGFARTADLQHFLEQASGQNLQEFFNDWFVGQGQPKVSVAYNCCGASSSFTVSQIPSHSSVSFFEMEKVPVVLQAFNGEKQEFTFSFTSNQQVVALPETGFEIDSILIDPEHYHLAKFAPFKVPITGAVKNRVPSFELFPMPGTDHIQVKSNSEITEIEVFDVFGKRTLHLKPAADLVTVSLQPMPTGFYWIKVQTNGQSLLKRFSKE